MGFQERVAAHQAELQKQAQNMQFMNDYKGNVHNQFSAIGINKPFKMGGNNDNYAYKNWWNESGAPNYPAMDQGFLPQELAGGGFKFGDLKHNTLYDLMMSGQSPTVDPTAPNQQALQGRLDKFKEMFQGMAPEGGYQYRPTQFQEQFLSAYSPSERMHFKNNPALFKQYFQAYKDNLINDY